MMRKKKEESFRAGSLSRITLSGANHRHVSTHQQQKPLCAQISDAQTALTGSAAQSSARNLPESLRFQRRLKPFFQTFEGSRKVCPPFFIIILKKKF